MEQPAVEPFNPARAMDANAIYASDPQSPTRRAIFREVYGADYPEEVAPNSFITMPLLRRLAQSLAAGPGAGSFNSRLARGGGSMISP